MAVLLPEPERPVTTTRRSSFIRFWGPVRCSRGYRRAPLLRCPQTPSAGVSALALGLRFWGPVRCSPAARAALLRCPQTPSAGVGALVLGLRPLLGRASSRGLRPVLARYVGCESNASAAPPRARGAGGRLGASRRRPPPSFWPARCAGRRPNSRAAPLRAPDPV